MVRVSCLVLVYSAVFLFSVFARAQYRTEGGSAGRSNSEVAAIQAGIVALELMQSVNYNPNTPVAVGFYLRRDVMMVQRLKQVLPIFEYYSQTELLSPDAKSVFSALASEIQHIIAAPPFIANPERYLRSVVQQTQIHLTLERGLQRLRRIFQSVIVISRPDYADHFYRALGRILPLIAAVEIPTLDITELPHKLAVQSDALGISVQLDLFNSERQPLVNLRNRSTDRQSWGVLAGMTQRMVLGLTRKLDRLQAEQVLQPVHQTLEKLLLIDHGLYALPEGLAANNETLEEAHKKAQNFFNQFTVFAPASTCMELFAD